MQDLFERLSNMVTTGQMIVGLLAASGGLMSYLYRHYGQNKAFDYKRWLLEGLMCGFIGLTVFYGLSSVGASQEVANFLGCSIGCIGVNASTELLKTVLSKRFGQP